jgi:hypothetical protein
MAAHLLLFVVFAWLLAGVLEREGYRRRTLGNTALWAVLILGTFQEILQGVAVGGFLGLDQVFDVAVDLIGGLIGLVLYGLTSSAKMRGLCTDPSSSKTSET